MKSQDISSIDAKTRQKHLCRSNTSKFGATNGEKNQQQQLLRHHANQRQDKPQWRGEDGNRVIVPHAPSTSVRMIVMEYRPNLGWDFISRRISKRNFMSTNWVYYGPISRKYCVPLPHLLNYNFCEIINRLQAILNVYLGFEQLHVIKQQNSDDFDDRLVIHKAVARASTILF